MTCFTALFSALFRRSERPRLPHRPGRRRRRMLPVLWGLALANFSGCNQSPLPPQALEMCRSLHVCDPPAAPKLLMDLGCDASLQAPCTKETLAETVSGAATYLANRPESRLRLWLLGGTVGATRLVAEVAVPPLKGKGPTSRSESTHRFVASTRELFLTAAQPAFSGKPPRQSPLIESLGKIALADGHGLPRHLVLISDARQVSSDTADFECAKRLPSEVDWLKMVRRLIPAGALSGVSLTFSYVTASPSGRCPVSVEREVAIRRLWEMAAKQAAAKTITFTSGGAALDSESSITLAGKE